MALMMIMVMVIMLMMTILHDMMMGWRNMAMMIMVMVTENKHMRIASKIKQKLL